MTKSMLAVALILMALPSTGMAPSKESLVGTWKLAFAKDTTDAGEVKNAYGQNPTGFLTYTSDGR
jgi:Lipocalin-like domain